MTAQTQPDRRRVYEGPRFDIDRFELSGRDGRAIQRDAIITPDAVVVLPLLDGDDTPKADRRVVMIRNERFAVGEHLWELCAGTLEEGERPDTCAGRELIEETGYEAGRIEPLLSFYSCPGICTERMYAFRATGLTHVGQQLDPNERIEVEVMTLGRAIEMVRGGEIHDAKTIATLLHYWAEIGRND